MKSVLISLDFVYKEDGSLVPLEMNTETLDDIKLEGDLDNGNFIELSSPFFRHEEFHKFLQSKNITKITLIYRSGGSRFIKAFCSYYNYTFTPIKVTPGSLTIPEVEDSPNTLIIRIAYDTYALIDDLYARDNFEFHNLIKDESFAGPVKFTEDNFDTINLFEPSQDGTIPNYVVKARTPGYNKSEYPRIYKLDTQDELDNLKIGLTEDEFIQKFEYNSELSLIDGRTHHVRSMNLICGSDLEVVNIINYKSLNMLSINNSKLVMEYELDSNKRLHPLNESRYYPTYLTKYGYRYHFDDHDKVLMEDDTLKTFNEIKSGDLVKGIKFEETSLSESLVQGMKRYKPLDQIQNYQLLPTAVKSFENANSGIFANITAYNSEYGNLSWYDGISNVFLTSGENIRDGHATFVQGGKLEIGQTIKVFEKNTNRIIDFVVKDVYFDTKSIIGYNFNLSEDTSQFFVELDEKNNLFLIQHNTCVAFTCFYARSGVYCGTYCYGCGKNSTYCINCGGSLFQLCRD